MSFWRAVKAIYESDLPPHLKPTVTAMLTFADFKEGHSIRPSLERVAWMVGKQVRSVRADVVALLQLRVLEALTVRDRSGGRGRTNEYRFVVEALPSRALFTKPGSPLPGKASETRKSRPENPAVTPTKPGSLAHENPVAHCRGSSLDLSDLKEDLAAMNSDDDYQRRKIERAKAMSKRWRVAR